MTDHIAQLTQNDLILIAHKFDKRIQAGESNAHMDFLSMLGDPMDAEVVRWGADLISEAQFRADLRKKLNGMSKGSLPRAASIIKDWYYDVNTDSNGIVEMVGHRELTDSLWMNLAKEILDFN